MDKKTIRIRRVGSVTFGIILILTGGLFLLHLAVPTLNYYMIYRFWPVILILLGLEVLAGARQKTYEVLDDAGKVTEQNKVVYDIPAILMMMALTGFAMCMAAVDWIYQISGGASVHFSI